MVHLNPPPNPSFFSACSLLLELGAGVKHHPGHLFVTAKGRCWWDAPPLGPSFVIATPICLKLRS